MIRRILAMGLIFCSAVAYSHGFDHARQLSSDHEFSAAAAELESILSQHPTHGLAWLNLASISLIMGDMERATQACGEAAKIVDPIATLTCRSRIALAKNETAPYLTRLSTLLDSSAYRHRTDPITAWAYAVAAELAVLDSDTILADRYFITAIQLGQPTQVTVAYADHLIQTERPEQVLHLAFDDKSLALKLRRLKVNIALSGAYGQRKTIRLLDRRFKHAIHHEEFEHGREFAYFYVHIKQNPTLAYKAAIENLKRQKEPEDLALLQQASQMLHQGL